MAPCPPKATTTCAVMTATRYGRQFSLVIVFSLEMDLLTLYDILEEKTDEELLLLACYFRDENDQMFSERSRGRC